MAKVTNPFHLVTLYKFLHMDWGVEALIKQDRSQGY